MPAILTPENQDEWSIQPFCVYLKMFTGRWGVREPCLEWCWCRRRWTASGSGIPPCLCPSPWWRSSGTECGARGGSTDPAGPGLKAEAPGWCGESDLSRTPGPRGSADPEASGRCISAERELEVLRGYDEVLAEEHISGLSRSVFVVLEATVSVSAVESYYSSLSQFYT